MRQLCKGNVAVVKGAILAGCRAYYGYPITPASEIAEAAALYFPQVGGTFIQAESEVAAINMAYGAAAAGGPGMAEGPMAPFELADKSPTPAVVRTNWFVGQMMERLELEDREIQPPENPW